MPRRQRDEERAGESGDEDVTAGGADGIARNRVMKEAEQRQSNNIDPIK